mmetsp:Transcript_11567/g.17496  ORF Transcript_11567/g.17496 Transcript_11567/m.17496 type:complete len:102 (-) Transcript_11567:938-1243(-)
MAPGTGESVREVRMVSVITATSVGSFDTLGVLDGDMVGKAVIVGDDDGGIVGLVVGNEDGGSLGTGLGFDEGLSDSDGATEGKDDGLRVRLLVGSRLIDGA